MDNPTHTLTGLLMSRAGLSRWHPQSVWLLMLAANIPDIDIAVALRGALPYFVAHRGYTHSIFLLPVMAFIPMLVVCAVVRSMRGWKAAYGLSLIGVASHLLLDWTNAYGIRFLYPFSGRWFHLDLNNIIDLWIWGVLAIATLGPMLGRLVSSEIGATSGSGRGMAIFALAFLVCYDFGRFLAHQRAIETLNSHVYLGSPPIRVGAFPVGLVNPFEWSGWIERPDFAMHFAMNLRTDFDSTGAEQTIYKAPPGPLLDAARQAYPVQKFLDFAQYPLWQVVPMADPEGANRVEVRDWRFPFTADAVFDRSNRLVSSSFHF
ncbi:MAG TPA: metal-dependent hydrolase [Bryobacteraceae bacterium]|nr:metal-dependent hydrolase [Bryobacteraceae bacterium]